MMSSSAVPADAPVSGQPFLRLAGVRKSYPGVLALAGFDMEVRPGEVIGLVGENGAGKSTLMKILGGVTQPDDGTIEIDGVPSSGLSVAGSMRAGIAFVHQELNLFDNLDVAANVYIGREPRRFGMLKLVDEDRMRADVAPLLKRLGANFAPDTPVATLSLAQQQLVEIAKALSVDARLVILDEPTSSLPLAETDRLLEVIAALKAEGIAVIFISHRLHEVERACDRVVVLRDGVLVGTLDRAAINHKNLVRLMIGRDLKVASARQASTRGTVALSATGIRTGAYPARDVSLDLHRGEILGLAGLVGSGRSELARALFGIDPIFGGTISMDGKTVAIRQQRRRDCQRHLSRAGGPQGRGHPARPVDCAEHRAAQPVALCRAPASSRAAARPARASRASATSTSARPTCRRAHRQPVGRQPAEGGARQVADDEPQGDDPRRADARHRHRRQGGDLPPDARSRGCGRRGADDLLRHGRGDRRVRPHRGDA